MTFLRSCWILGLTVTLVLLAALVSAASAASNLTLTFVDGTDQLSVSITGDKTRVDLFPPCKNTPEECGFHVFAPSAGASIVSQSLPLTGEALIQECLFPMNVCDVSDDLSVTFFRTTPALPFTEYFGTFFSDSEPATDLGRCGPQVGLLCNFLELGKVQLIGSITWSDGTVDTINFCSEVEAQTSSCSPSSSVPEPSTMMLLGVGLLGLAGITWKRYHRK